MIFLFSSTSLFLMILSSIFFFSPSSSLLPLTPFSSRAFFYFLLFRFSPSFSSFLLLLMLLSQPSLSSCFFLHSVHVFLFSSIYLHFHPRLPRFSPTSLFTFPFVSSSSFLLCLLSLCAFFFRLSIQILVFSPFLTLFFFSKSSYRLFSCFSSLLLLSLLSLPSSALPCSGDTLYTYSCFLGCLFPFFPNAF